MEESLSGADYTPLSHTVVQKAKAIEKDLTLHDGDGLFPLVKTTGKKLWRLRYLRPGTRSRTMVSLGAYPALSLADARQIRAEKLAILARGIDPQAKEAEEAKQKQVAQESIFLNVAKQWFASKQASVSAKHAEDIWPPPRGLPSGYVKSQPLLLISGGRNPSA